MTRTAIGRAIEELISIVSPATFYRWVRDEINCKPKPKNPKGGQRKPKELLELVLMISEQTGFGLNRTLHVPMDDYGFIWVGTGMTTEGLDKTFLWRFPVKFRMTLPDLDSLALWLTKRSTERGIECESLEVMWRLAERSRTG